MKHMGDDDLEVLQKVEAIHKELREKEGEYEDLDALNQTLIIKERKCNDELQEARKELISVSFVFLILITSYIAFFPTITFDYFSYFIKFTMV